MSDPQVVPDEDRPVLPDDDDKTEDLQEPSTEKEPGEEPKAPENAQEPQPSHEAVGIGVIGRPQTEPDET